MQSPRKQLTREEILNLISKLKEDPSAKLQVLADLGVATAGMAGAGAIAAIAGTTVAPIGFGITALTGFGMVVAAPVGLVAGAAIAGGAAAYGVTQVVKFKARQQGKCEQMIQQLKELLRDLDYNNVKSQNTDADRTRFIVFLEEPVNLNLMSPEDASDLIELVENGQISLFEAYRLVKDILEEFIASKRKKADILLPKLLGGSPAYKLLEGNPSCES